jgi:hypothetical protein
MFVNRRAPPALIDGSTMPGLRWGGNANEYLSDAACREGFPAAVR